MKKLFLGIFLGLIAGCDAVCHAGQYFDSPTFDTTTPSGYANMGLVGNFYLYASTNSKTPVATFSSTGGIINADTTTLTGLLKASSATFSMWVVFAGTVTYNNTVLFSSTITVSSGTFTNLSASTGVFNVVQGSSGTFNNVSGSTGTFGQIQTTSGTATQIVSTTGTFKAIKWADGTIQTSSPGASAGGGGIGLTLNTTYMFYQAIIGTIAANGANYIGTSSVPFINVVNDLCGSSSTNICRSAVQVFVQPGVYNVTNATIPTNMKMVFASSAVVTNGLINAPVFTQYGETWYPNYDFWENTNFKTPHVDYKNGAREYGAKIIGLVMDATTTGPMPFRVQNATDVVISGAQVCASSVTAGAVNGSTYLIVNSTDVTFDGIRSTSARTMVNTTDGFIKVMGGSKLVVKNCNITWGGIWFYCLLSGSGAGNLNGLTIHNNDITIPGLDGGAGSLTLQTVGTPNVISSGTVISDNRFILLDRGGSFVISLYDPTSLTIKGVVIQNNVVYSPYTNTHTFVKVFHASISGTILTGNKTFGVATFLTDAGTGTQSATLGNFKDSVQQ